MVNFQWIITTDLNSFLHLTQRIQINVHVDRKIFYQQRIVFMFGPRRLREILESPLPVVIPMINYENSFDVHVFILF